MQKLIIDTDPGIDDAQAILMAAAHPNTEITAILAVGGNVGLNHTTRNALTLTEVIRQDIPVYPGCDGPLVFPGEDAAFVHGSDGLGDVGLRPKAAQAQKEHAALALIRLVKEAPETYTLVALGPLTNIALALKLEPELPKLLKNTVVMGGAVTGKGNTSNLAAEFNIFADPEAAFVVFEAWAKAQEKITLVDWEATLRHGIPPETLKTWLALDTPKSRFFDQITAKAIIASKKRRGGDETFFSADGLAMAVALEADIILRAESHYLSVETQGQFSRGQTIVDWQNRSQHPANAHIVLDINQNRFQALLREALG